MDVSDEDLRGYLDGALDPAVAAGVEAALDGDPALERRLMALDPLAAPVKAALAGLPEDARIARLQAALDGAHGGALDGAHGGALDGGAPLLAPRARWGSRVWGGLAAACLVGVMVGWGAADFAAPAKADWRVEVAHYQALYTGDTIDGIALSEAELAGQLARAGAMTGAELSPDALGGIEGMELLRAQVLGFGETPLAQIVFRGAGGAPIALCLIRTEGAAAGVDVAEMLGLASASWAEGGVEYLLIGGADADWIASRADAIRAALGQRA